MGLFDFLFGGGGANAIVKYGRKLKNKDTPIEERQEAARWLAREGSHEAVKALLGRFEMDYEHGMKDASEKDDVAELVIDLGPKAVEPLRDFLLRTEKFARPLALYEQLTSAEQAQALALEMLAREADRSELKPGRKRNLLVKMADFKGDAVVEAVRPFLMDYDEGCRFAAVETLLGQPDSPAVREALLGVLVSPREESNRLKIRVAEAAARGRWELGANAEAIAAAPPLGFKVSGGALVRAGHG